MRKVLFTLLLYAVLTLSTAGCGAASTPDSQLRDISSPTPMESGDSILEEPAGVTLEKIDWSSFQNLLSLEAYEALQSYLPVLIGDEAFLWTE